MQTDLLKSIADTHAPGRIEIMSQLVQMYNISVELSQHEGKLSAIVTPRAPLESHTEQLRGVDAWTVSYKTLRPQDVAVDHGEDSYIFKDVLDTPLFLETIAGIAHFHHAFLDVLKQASDKYNKTNELMKVSFHPEDPHLQILNTIKNSSLDIVANVGDLVVLYIHPFSSFAVLPDGLTEHDKENNMGSIDFRLPEDAEKLKVAIDNTVELLMK